MNNFATEQENFRAWEFWDDYIARNTGTEFLANQIIFRSKIVSNISKINSIIEFGANIWVNLEALKTLLPKAELSAIEINDKACEIMKEWSKGTVKTYSQSILDFTPDYKRDFVFTKGVLIHINPDKLPEVYDRLYNTSSRYICVAEYYNPVPMGMPYRWNENRLFKRDFCGEIMDRFKDLELVDYGFAYHRDPNFPQDDINRFLLEKKQ
jgi:pseudaminic acid biosynthesis-associated methylase